MVSILFWNLAQNPKTIPSIVRLAVRYEVDVFFLAECPNEVDSIAALLSERGRGSYRVADRGLTKVRGVSLLPASDLFVHSNNGPQDMTIWNLVNSDPGRIQTQIAVVHLLSKVGGNQPADQQAVATRIAQEIVEYEDREGCYDTVLLGDLNMNPFEPGMVIVSGLHATMTKRIATLADRKWRGERYRRFYNPMWGLFGDRTPGPAGTHYWESSVTSNQHWHMFDQVLLRPSLIDRLISIEIVDHDGIESLVDEDGSATRAYLSDHLPIHLVLEI
jgi:hypothetical protein